MRQFRILVTAILTVLVVAIAAHPASAATGGVVGAPLSTCIARDRPGTNARQMFAHPLRFDCRRRQTSFGQGDFWVLSQSLAGIDRRQRRNRVRVASLWQNDITLYALYPDGHIARQALDGRATSRHLQLGAIVEWRLAQRGPPPVRLLWHVGGAANLHGIVNAPTLALPRESNAANLSMGAIYAGFGGLCLALLIYNFVMWGALRYRFQLVYCAMVLALLVYAFTSSGALAWVEPTIRNNDRLRLNYLMLALAACTALYFARAFFEARVTAGRVTRLIDVVISLLLIVTVAFAALAPWRIGMLDTMYAFAFTAILIAAAAIIIRAWKLQSSYLLLFAFAWAAPILFACIRLLANLSFLPWNFWIDNSTILSMSFEAVMSTLAIAYRIRLLSNERDEARTKEVAARMLAETDPLTGLLNRRAFLAKAMARSGDRLLMLADIDHFKRVNDTLGHDGGDEVLRVFARKLREIVPDDALVARIGGEEFAILLPARDGFDPETVLSDLRRTRMPFDMAVTCSIGSSTGPLAGENDWKQLYRHADRALFAAKAAGRDRCRRAADSVAAA